VSSDLAPTEAPRSSLGAGSVVVFDFDGTLVSRDSFIDFSLRYCARRPARLLAVVAALPLALLLRLRSLQAASSVLLWVMTVGAPTRQFVLALRRYAMRTLPGYAHDAIFAELSRHLDAGNRVVIATGTVPLLARGLLGARGLGRLPVVGSRMYRRWGGLVAGTHCIGRVKVRELKRKLGIESWVSVYTDSLADRSLMLRARDVTLVGPSRRTLRRTQRMMSEATTLRVLYPGSR